MPASWPAIDRHTKLQLYARYRVPHYWIVDPDGPRLEAYDLVAGTYEEAGRAVGNESVTLHHPFTITVTPALLLDL